MSRPQRLLGGLREKPVAEKWFYSEGKKEISMYVGCYTSLVANGLGKL